MSMIKREPIWLIILGILFFLFVVYIFISIINKQFPNESVVDNILEMLGVK